MTMGSENYSLGINPFNVNPYLRDIFSILTRPATANPNQPGSLFNPAFQQNPIIQGYYSPQFMPFSFGALPPQGAIGYNPYSPRGLDLNSFLGAGYNIMQSIPPVSFNGLPAPNGQSTAQNNGGYTMPKGSGFFDFMSCAMNIGTNAVQDANRLMGDFKANPEKYLGKYDKTDKSDETDETDKTGEDKDSVEEARKAVDALTDALTDLELNYITIEGFKNKIDDAKALVDKIPDDNSEGISLQKILERYQKILDNHTTKSTTNAEGDKPQSPTPPSGKKKGKEAGGGTRPGTSSVPKTERTSKGEAAPQKPSEGRGVSLGQAIQGQGQYGQPKRPNNSKPVTDEFGLDKPKKSQEPYKRFGFAPTGQLEGPADKIH
ncbi:MAG: hypothetical protein PHC64_10650 [Candidatus Gastranaerophilales bacterium]|nr:hypothetical protein [Candidatus Gastranaerophilales bacterium]